MRGKYLILKIGAVAEAGMLAFAQKFFGSLGEKTADGVYKHQNVDVQVVSKPMPPPANHYVMWWDNGVWRLQSQHGRWYWTNTHGWYPG